MAQFKKEIEEFAGRVQGIVDRHYAESFVNLPVPTITVKFGRKYAKLIREDSTGALGRTQKFVYGFVSVDTGDIYKAATWNAPAKHARGSIFNDDGGMNACTPYGIIYL
jgi:hypothetical protein